MSEAARMARRDPTLANAAGVRPLPRATRFILRGGPDAIEAASKAWGLELPTLAGGSAQRGEGPARRAALWLGPDEWLLLAPESEFAACTAALTPALAGIAHSLVDVSHRQVALEIAGARAAAMLSSGCPLDLDLTAFPVGRCARTMFAKAEVILWRQAPEMFQIEVWRSFAEYVTGLLELVGREAIP